MKEEIGKCKVCGERFERDPDRPEGKLVSCPKHSFGEVEEPMPKPLEENLETRVDEILAKINRI